MIVIGLALLIGCGALASPLLLAWGVRCLTRPQQRSEGILLLGSGVLLTGAVGVVGFLTAPPEDRVLRPVALVFFAGYFGLGAAAAEFVYRAVLILQRHRPGGAAG